MTSINAEGMPTRLLSVDYYEMIHSDVHFIPDCESVSFRLRKHWMVAIIPFSVPLSVMINVGHPSLSSMAFRKKSPIIRGSLLLLVTFNQRILRLNPLMQPCTGKP